MDLSPIKDILDLRVLPSNSDNFKGLLRITLLYISNDFLVYEVDFDSQSSITDGKVKWKGKTQIFDSDKDGIITIDGNMISFFITKIMYYNNKIYLNDHYNIYEKLMGSLRYHMKLMQSRSELELNKLRKNYDEFFKL